MQIVNAVITALNFQGSTSGSLSVSCISNDFETYANCNNPNFGEEFSKIANAFEITKIASLPPEFIFIFYHKGTQTSYFAVDCFATKPLYYAFDGTELLINNNISSLVKQLKKVTLNKNKIASYFNWETDEEPISNTTFYTEIKRLLPAQVGVFKNGNLSIQNYWKLPINNSQIADNQRIDKIRKTFINAVNQRLVRPTISANLSGGLDSSSIVSTISALKKKPFTSIYFDTKTKQGDETNYVNVVVESSKTIHQQAEHPPNIYCLLKKVTSYIGQPDPGVLPAFIHFQVFEKAKQQNTDLLFSGHGGDSIIGYGFEYLQQLLQNSKWKALRKACKQYETLHVQPILGRLFKSEIKKAFKKKHLFKTLSLFLVATFYFNENFFSVLWESKKGTKVADYKYFEDRILFRKLQKECKKEVVFDVNNLFENLSENEINYLNYNFNTLTINGNEVLTLLGNYFDIGVSFPFFDKEMIESSYSISSRLRFGNGYTRGVIREIMEGILPPQIRNRTTKADFTNYAIQCYNSLYLPFKADFPPDHKLWVYIDKNVFEDLTKIILDTSIPPSQKVRYNWLGMRVINFGLWLNEYEKATSNAL